MSAFDPYLQLIREKWKEFITWVKPDPADALHKQVFKIVLKIPLILLGILVSPLALVVLLFAFIAAF